VAAETGGALLEIEGLTKDFRGLRAVDGHSLRIGREEILGVIGPNGAGKTTLFNLITGLIRPTSGRILFLGRSITRLAPDAIARLGIARTFQNIRIFAAMSVLDNVLVAAQMHARVNPLAALLSAPGFLRGERRLRETARELLGRFGLERQAALPAGSLPYGAQRRLEIARALATGPRLLLLDEPTVGMNPRESGELLELIRAVRDAYGLSIMLVAHDLRLVMGLCHRIQVLTNGRLIAEGAPAEIRGHPLVIEAYLGRTAGRAQA
jgi:branched-chain amino acid transport system ATP-binding protein